MARKLRQVANFSIISCALTSSVPACTNKTRTSIFAPAARVILSSINAIARIGVRRAPIKTQFRSARRPRGRFDRAPPYCYWDRRCAKGGSGLMAASPMCARPNSTSLSAISSSLAINARHTPLVL